MPCSGVLPLSSYKKESREQLQPASVLANLTDAANPANRALILCVILGTINSTLLVRSAAIDWSVAGSTDLELSELIEFNVDSVAGVPFTLGFRPFGLCCTRVS